jgi:ABC-type transporter Mla subunit MlaD
MSIRRGSKNNILAGIFLIGSLALGLGVFFVLANLWDKFTVKRHQYSVNFSLSEGADGLETGAIVKVGGVKAGQVVGWSYALDDTGGRITGIDIQVEVNASIVLYENASPMLILPLLGSNSTINFPDVGDPAKVVNPMNGNPRLEPGEIIVGHLAPPTFLSQAGYGPDQAKQLQRIIKNAEETSDRINRITATVEGELEPRLAEVRSILADGQKVTSDARQSWEQWRARVDSALANVEEASKKLDAMMADARAGVEDARKVISTAQGMLDENRPKVTATVDNIKELSDKLKSDTYAALMEVLDGANKGVEEFALSAERVRVLVGRRASDLETTIANARLASDQLKLTMVEIRQAPWKLLAAPTGRKDLENEVLYDSVRAYAAAVADLRAAAASLDEMTQATSARLTDLDRKTIEEMNKELSDAFERYGKAEREFLKRWVGEK